MDNKIRIIGDANQIKRGMELFKDIDQSDHEGKNRLIIQDIIDTYNFKGTVLYDGNTVRSYKKTIKAFEDLFNKGLTAFNKYHYSFMMNVVGTIAHYDINWWLATYDMHQVKQLIHNATRPSRATDTKQILDWLKQL